MASSPANKGNLVTRRAFAERDDVELPDYRMKALRRVVNKAMSTAYQMTEECGEYGSGTPSPAHMLCELIREAHEMDAREGVDYSTAQELAEYPLTFLTQLRGGGVEAGGDFICKKNRMMKAGTDANFMLKGRELHQLTPGELHEFSASMMTVATLARELEQMADRALAEVQFPGAPIQSERPFRRTGTDDR